MSYIDTLYTEPAEETAGAGGIDFGSGWASTLQDVLKIGAQTYQQTALMQQNQQGQRFIEGQRLAALRGGVGGIPSGTLLLVGGALLVYMLMKG